MRRTIGGALVILAALAMPSAADVPANETLAVHQQVTEQPCPTPAEDAAAGRSQVASLPDCKDCTVPAVTVDRPINRPRYSPIGRAVLELLRSQGGGHLRP